MGTYEDVFRASTEDPESFWLKAAEGIDWDVAPHRALDSSGAPFYRWFPDGRLNVCFNALDRHVEAGRGEQPALVYDSPVTDIRRTYTSYVGRFVKRHEQVLAVRSFARAA
jgi:propionyl-CoA synthetase